MENVMIKQDRIPAAVGDEIRFLFEELSLEALGSHMMFGDVDVQSVGTACNFILKANKLLPRNQPLTLYINSLGGSCYDGFALIDLMDASRIPIYTVGMGNIVSMGVLIMAAGAKGHRVMTRNTQVMAHQFYGGSEGKFHELLEAHKAELYLKHQFTQHFLRHTKMSEKQINEIMFGPSDRWLTPGECKKLGIVDHVVDELPTFKNLPEESAAVRKPRARAQQSVIQHPAETPKTGRQKKH